MASDEMEWRETGHGETCPVATRIRNFDEEGPFIMLRIVCACSVKPRLNAPSGGVKQMAAIVEESVLADGANRER